jgi:hypothetical protein
MRIEGLSRLMGNMRMGIGTVHLNLERRDDTAVRRALLQLSRDIHSFRRVFDQLLIETAASSDIALDEQLMAKLRSLWNKEESFAFRFDSEAVKLSKLEELRSIRLNARPGEPSRIPGATNPVLTLPSVVSTDAGIYTFVSPLLLSMAIQAKPRRLPRCHPSTQRTQPASPSNPSS